MGLDMFAYVTYEDISSVDFKHPDDAIELHYWRKHPDLHGWMEHLYYAKGGQNNFNMAPVALDAVDLAVLKLTVEKEALPKTEGFFFGTSRPENKEDDLVFVQKAEDAMVKGAKVFYTSWW